MKFDVAVDGHLLIKDDLGMTHLDQWNAVHPQNMARIFARALAHEDNFYIHRMAFGNGGTAVNASLKIEYNTPNDGQDPDPSGWESRLYNETYSEVVDDSSALIGTGPGADPSGDPEAQEHVSGPGTRSAELGLTSQVVIEVVLNPNEPFGQDVDDSSQTNPNSDFTFDEIGLYTIGLPPTQTTGYQNVNVGTKVATALTGLSTNTAYIFTIKVNNGANKNVTITTPSSGSGASGEILYSDLINLINNATPFGATASISNVDTGVNTFGFLKITSNTSGTGSSVIIIDGGQANFLFRALAGYQGLETPVTGQAAGVANDAVNAENQRERLLTHITFSPVLKSATRSLIITYTLTISIARSVA